MKNTERQTKELGKHIHQPIKSEKLAFEITREN